MCRSRVDSLVGVRWITVALIVGMLCAVFTNGSAGASPLVKFNVTLEPEKLGGSTTISVGFRIVTAPNQIPPPLTSFNVELPAGMGLAGTDMGVDTCSAEAIVRDGTGGCPPDSAMGFGSGLAETAFGSEIVRETGRVSAYMTQAVDENTTLLYYFDGRRPVIAPLVFRSELLSPGYSPISELVTELPLISALPETPDAGIVALQVSLGPRHVTYYKRVGNRTVSYKPHGIAVPATCPRGGFRFLAHFAFADGTRVSTLRRVACP
jgi:hypothetical protein